jgi:hypothetical protein
MRDTYACIKNKGMFSALFEYGWTCPALLSNETIVLKKKVKLSL